MKDYTPELCELLTYSGIVMTKIRLHAWDLKGCRDVNSIKAAAGDLDWLSDHLHNVGRVAAAIKAYADGTGSDQAIAAACEQEFGGVAHWYRQTAPQSAPLMEHLDRIMRGIRRKAGPPASAAAG